MNYIKIGSLTYLQVPVHTTSEEFVTDFRGVRCEICALLGFYAE